MSSIGEAWVRLRSDDRGYARQVDTQVSRTVRGVALRAGALLGAGFGVSKLVSELGEAVKAGREASGIAAQTQAALAAAGQSWQLYGQEIEKVTNQQADAFALDDEELQQSFTTIFRNVRDVTKALELNADAANLARGKNISLASAATIVAKVHGGNVAILRRYGIQIDKNATSEQALAALRERFAGAARAFAESEEGSQARLQKAYGDTQEIIGQGLAPVIERLGETVRENLQRWNESGETQKRVNQIMETGEKVVKGAAEAYGILHSVVKPLVSAVGGVENAVKLLVLALAVSKVLRFATALRGIYPAALKARAGLLLLNRTPVAPPVATPGTPGRPGLGGVAAVAATVALLGIESGRNENSKNRQKFDALTPQQKATVLEKLGRDGAKEWFGIAGSEYDRIIRAATTPPKRTRDKPWWQKLTENLRKTEFEGASRGSRPSVSAGLTPKQVAGVLSGFGEKLVDAEISGDETRTLTLLDEQTKFLRKQIERFRKNNAVRRELKTALSQSVSEAAGIRERRKSAADAARESAQAAADAKREADRATRKAKAEEERLAREAKKEAERQKREDQRERRRAGREQAIELRLNKFETDARAAGQAGQFAKQKRIIDAEIAYLEKLMTGTKRGSAARLRYRNLILDAVAEADRVNEQIADRRKKFTDRWKTSGLPGKIATPIDFLSKTTLGGAGGVGAIGAISGSGRSGTSTTSTATGAGRLVNDGTSTTALESLLREIAVGQAQRDLLQLQETRRSNSLLSVIAKVPVPAPQGRRGRQVESLTGLPAYADIPLVTGGTP